MRELVCHIVVAPGRDVGTSSHPEKTGIVPLAGKKACMSRSPWAWQPSASIAVISPPAGPVEGDIFVPGSKSFTNRALLVAALARGRSRLHGVLRSDDGYWAVHVLRELGVALRIDETTVEVEGCGGAWPVSDGRLYVGSAGTLARFLPGALAAAETGEWEVDGSEQLRGRPVAPLVTALRELGADVSYLSDAPGLPMRVAAGLRGGTVRIPGNVSSQFTSGVLLAAPYAEQPVTVHVVDGLVQPEYVGITIELMRAFGARITHDGDYMSITVEPTPYKGREYELEADASTACYFLTLAALTQGRVRVTNVGYDSLQPDARFVDVLEQMGCHVRRGTGFLEVIGPPNLKGNLTVDMRPMSDQALTLGAAAVFADGPVTVTGVPHIRRHESDRIRVFCEQMKRVGIRVDEREDGFVVHPGQPEPGPVLDPHDDHRQAMAFALLGARVPGIRIHDPGCVSKTCPPYFDMLAELGIRVDYEQ